MVCGNSLCIKSKAEENFEAEWNKKLALGTQFYWKTYLRTTLLAICTNAIKEITYMYVIG